MFKCLENRIFTEKPTELGFFRLREMTVGQLSLMMHKELLWKETANALAMFTGKSRRKNPLTVYNNHLRHN